MTKFVHHRDDRVDNENQNFSRKGKVKPEQEKQRVYFKFYTAHTTEPPDMP